MSHRLSELDEWKQAASVEAGLRREFLARAEKAEAEVARLTAALELIAGASADKLQAMQARNALDNIGAPSGTQKR